MCVVSIIEGCLGRANCSSRSWIISIVSQLNVRFFFNVAIAVRKSELTLHIDSIS